MKDNTIRDNSLGIQANNNVNINQTVNELPDAMQNMFVELLKPSIKQIGENLQNEISSDISTSIGKEIRSILEKSFVQSIKEQVYSQNLNSHIQVVFKRIHNENSNRRKPIEEIHETLEKTDLFMEWVENAEHIPSDGGDLSKIWQNWLYELSQGSNTSDQKILLNIMKKLTPEDANTLLRFRWNKRLFSRSYLESSGKSKYITNKLSEIGLIKRNYFSEIVLFFLLIILGWYFKDFIDSQDYASKIKFSYETVIYLVSVSVPLLVYFIKPCYQLTWIGKEIVSYANPKKYSLTSKSLASIKDSGISEDITKNLKPLLYTKFHTESDFNEAVKSHIGHSQFEKYNSVILKYGTH
ncbi:MAG: hypothetical protein V3U87_10800 [Methylococcaceae bacterium]